MNRGIVLLLLVFFFPCLSWAIDYQAKEGAVAYNEANIDATAIYRFKAGEEFKVTNKEDGWLEVQFADKVKGYIKETETTSSLVQPDPPTVTLKDTQTPQEAPQMSAQSRDALAASVKTFRRLAAATEAGLNFSEYGTRLVDAKTEIEDNSASLSPEQKSQVQAVFQVYQDARDWWYWKVVRAGYRKCSGGECLYTVDDNLIYSLRSKYPFFGSIIIQQAQGGIWMPEGRLSHATGLSLLWSHAREQTDKLNASLPPVSEAASNVSQDTEGRLQNLKTLRDKG